MKLKFLWLLIFSVFFFGLLAIYGLPAQIKQEAILPSFSPQSLFGRLLQKKEEPVIIIATGDVMLGRSVNAKMRSLSDFTYPFLKTAGFLKSADLTLINLESPFVSNCPTANTGMTFCADPKAVEGLKFAGLDIVNLANNHILNYGNSGLDQTLKILRDNKIHFISTFLFDDLDDRIIELKGVKLGFLGFDLTGKHYLNQILDKIKTTKNQVDILIVSFHWGTEYAKKPSQKQIELAHQVINAGADLIIGHHPHVIQQTEEYKGKLIIYSLGNFIFDQPWSEETKKGLVGRFTFQNKKLLKSEFFEIHIQDFCQPEFVNLRPKGLEE